MTLEESRWRRVSLEEAADALESCFADFIAEGDPKRILLPDPIFVRAQAAGFRLEVSPYNWRALADQKIYDDIVERCGPFTGEILLISESSFDEGVGAFGFAPSDADVVIRQHQQQFGPVFNGDLILVVPQNRIVACMHHEGGLIVMSPPAVSCP
jgi:hypothetical protein